MHFETLENKLDDHQKNEIEAYRELRSRLDSTDPYRPTYHFTPPGGIVHDPNGASYWNGRYHLFYQFRPPGLDESVPWERAMHWGHAVSEDLVHWQDLPIALAPETGPEYSCYSGQALVEHDRVVLMYHGPGAGNCIAISDDPLLINFEKHTENPVVPLTDDDEYTVFDPDIWAEDGTYYSLSGTQRGERFGDGVPTAHLFRSEDLLDWEYTGPFLETGEFTAPGEDAAVPNFVEFDERDLLLCFSHHRGPHYYLGVYDRETGAFEPERHGRMTHGPATHSDGIGGLGLGTLHAPSVLSGPEGRQIAFFNVIDGKPQEGWSQIVALPRVLEVDERGRLTVEAPSELETLRNDSTTVSPRSISNEEIVVAPDAGRAIEIEATLDPDTASVVGLSVLRSNDSTESTTISYYERSDTLELDTTRSTTRTDVPTRPGEQAPLALDAKEPLRVRVYVDRSVVEAFANGRRCLTARVYPEMTSTGLSVFARRGIAELKSLTVHDLAAIWSDGQPTDGKPNGDGLEESDGSAQA
ncbi:MAG: glycoside hydrolase family 32 protein [archaeon]